MKLTNHIKIRTENQQVHLSKELKVVPLKLQAYFGFLCEVHETARCEVECWLLVVAGNIA